MSRLHPIFQSLLSNMPPALHDVSRNFLAGQNPRDLFSPNALAELTNRLDRGFGQKAEKIAVEYESIVCGQYETDEPGLVIEVQDATKSCFGSPREYPNKGLVNGRHDFDIDGNGYCFARRHDAAVWFCRLTLPVKQPTLAEQAQVQLAALKEKGVAGEDLAKLENLIAQMGQA